jgi:Flp pilus assembly protein TadG
VGPKKASGFRRVGRDDEGAETVEFAIVVVLLITLLYGIVSIGLSLAAKVTLTQAAADGARAGIVMPTTALQISTADAAAANDVAWMGKGTCGTTTTAGTTITCVTTVNPANCSSPNYPPGAAPVCLTTTVTYNYAASPLFPALPGFGILSPHTITTSSTLQVSTPSS